MNPFQGKPNRPNDNRNDLNNQTNNSHHSSYDPDYLQDIGRPTGNLHSKQNAIQQDYENPNPNDRGGDRQTGTPNNKASGAEQLNNNLDHNDHSNLNQNYAGDYYNLV